MIVVREDSTLRVVTQSDHARVAGDLLARWQAGRLPQGPRQADLLLATAEHDNGWWEADAAPRCDATTGGPVDFIAMPAAERIAIWRRGTARHATDYPYAALLITEHALQLGGGAAAQGPAAALARCGDSGETAEWEEFRADLHELAARLASLARATREEVEQDYRFLDLADVVSLAACGQLRAPFCRHGIAVQPRAGSLLLDPFPLARPASLRIPFRRIPDRAYRGDADLGGELAAARWQQLEVTVAGPG